jgi:hydroxyethylthiazole kinase
MRSELSWPDPTVRAALTTVAAAAPLVHCLTNIVVAGFTANVLLAIGASPAMVENAQEAGPFAAIAGGVLVNLGTLSEERERAMVAAAAGAHSAGRPWVLDPVAVGALEHRTVFAKGLLVHRPTVIRGNASEILALAGAGTGGKGVDSTATSLDALLAARSLATEHGAVIAVSGEIDLITDGTSVIEVSGGHPLMTRVTGVGCALGAMIAAFCAIEAPPLAAAAGASAVLAAAGSAAAVGSPGTGTFAVRLLDQLHALAGAPGA